MYSVSQKRKPRFNFKSLKIEKEDAKTNNRKCNNNNNNNSSYIAHDTAIASICPGKSPLVLNRK